MIARQYHYYWLIPCFLFIVVYIARTILDTNNTPNSDLSKDYQSSTYYYSCFGLTYYSPYVCSSRGYCLAEDHCVCYTGYYGLNCASELSCKPNSSFVCSSHGKCTDFNKCECNQNYFGDKCEITKCFNILSNNTSTCSYHGECIDLDLCRCEENYFGANCEITKCFGKFSNDTNSCSATSECTSFNECTCKTGWTGPNCSIPICYGILANDPTVCSTAKHGKCILPDTCECKSGYTGFECEDISCFGVLYNSSNVCSSRGYCLEPNFCVCNSEPPYNYWGSNCEISSCFGEFSNTSVVCSSHGKCTDFNKCECNQNYFGDNCEITTCFNKLNNDTNSCSGNGDCISFNECKCKTEYTGLECNVRKTPSLFCFGFSQSDSRTCSSHGSCISTDNCQCSNEWSGSLCDIPKCNGIVGDNSKVCSGNGKCVGVNNCSCNEGYQGNECEHFKCFSLLNNDINVCNGNGTCIHLNQCECKPNYFGNDCSFKNSTITTNNSTIMTNNSTIITNNSTTITNNSTIITNNSTITNSTHLKVKFSITSNNENLQYINPNEDLILKSIIIDESLSNILYSYKWTCPISGIDTTNSYLIIPKSLLFIGYSFSVTLEISSSNPTMETVSKTIKLKINEPPKLGTFYISPKSGFILETQFKLEAVDWYDENEPLTYRFVYRYENEKTWKTLSEQSKRQLLYTELPLGIIQLSVFIYDSFNSFIQSEIVSVQVSQKSQISTETLTKLENQTSISTPILSTLSNIISNENGTSFELKEKVVQIISKFFTKQLDQLGDLNMTSNQLSSSVSTISSISSSISHLDTNTKSVVLDYFSGTLEKVASNNIPLSNDDFQTCLLSISMMEEQTSKRITQKYTKVIKIYKLLSEIKSRSLLEDGSPNRISGKVFKSYSKYVKSYSALQDILYDQTRINMRALQVPSCIVNVKTYTNELLNSNFNFSKIIEFTLQNANTMQNIDLSSSNVLSQFVFPLNSISSSRSNMLNSISTSCKFQSSNGDFVADFCILNNNDEILSMNISRTGIYMISIGYQEVVTSIDPIIPKQPTHPDDSTSSSSSSPMIIGLSVGLPVLIFIVIFIILLVMVFYLLRRNRDAKSKVEKTSNNVIDGQYLENLQNVKSKQDFEMKETENINVKLDEPSSLDFEPLEQGPLLIPQEELTVISKLGSGGFGTVYKTEYKPKRGDLKFVAVKSIYDDDSLMGSAARNSTSSQTISSEALLMCSLDHPNIVKCFGISIKESIQLIVMEYVEGGSLEELINELKSGNYFMDVNEKIDILIQISKGIHYLHNLSMPIVHRDLKPANCLLDISKKSCKLCDFGLSKAYSGNTMNSMTNNIGTLYYMANVSLF